MCELNQSATSRHTSFRTLSFTSSGRVAPADLIYIIVFRWVDSGGSADRKMSHTLFADTQCLQPMPSLCAGDFQLKLAPTARSTATAIRRPPLPTPPAWCHGIDQWTSVGNCVHCGRAPTGKSTSNDATVVPHCAKRCWHITFRRIGQESPVSFFVPVQQVHDARRRTRSAEVDCLRNFNQITFFVHPVEN